MKRLNIDMDFFSFFLAFYTAKKPSGEKELKLTICWFQSEDNKGGQGVHSGYCYTKNEE